MSADIGHRIATKAAMQIVKEAAEADLDWVQISIAMESAVAIVVATCASMAQTPRPVDFVREVIDVMTERAHVRAIEVITGRPAA